MLRFVEFSIIDSLLVTALWTIMTSSYPRESVTEILNSRLAQMNKTSITTQMKK